MQTWQRAAAGRQLSIGSKSANSTYRTSMVHVGSAEKAVIEPMKTVVLLRTIAMLAVAAAADIFTK